GAAGRGAGGGGRGAGADSSSAAAAAQKAALVSQQRQLFQVLKDRAIADSLNRADGRGGAAGRGGGGNAGRGGAGGRGGGAAAGGPPAGPSIRTFNVAGNERLGSMSLAPSGRALLVTLQTPGIGAATPTLVPSWVTTSGYVEEINGRSKVGDVTGGSSR